MKPSNGGCPNGRRCFEFAMNFRTRFASLFEKDERPCVGAKRSGYQLVCLLRRARGIFHSRACDVHLSFMLAAALLFAAASAVLAHDPGLSSVLVIVQPERCDVVLSFSSVDAKLIVNSESQSDSKEVANKLKASVVHIFELKFDDTRSVAMESSCFVEGNNVSVQLGCRRPPSTRISIRPKWISLLPPGHRVFVTIRNPDNSLLAERLLNASDDAVFIGFSRAAEKANSERVNESFTGFLAMGVKHIMTGYDHLLFLFGLLVVTRSFQVSIKIITCFTVAHSLTLTLATLNLVQISSRIVEPLIAASIVVVGVENFLRSGEPKGRWLLAFSFGTVHGLGFASALREAGVGQNGDGIAVPLLAFNSGVELGQAAVAAVALPLIWKLRAWPGFTQHWIPSTSAVVTLLGGWFLVTRIWL